MEKKPQLKREIRLIENILDRIDNDELLDYRDTFTDEVQIQLEKIKAQYI